MDQKLKIDYSDPGSVKAIRSKFKNTDYTRDIACPKKFVLNQKPAPAAKPIIPKKGNFSKNKKIDEKEEEDFSFKALLQAAKQSAIVNTPEPPTFSQTRGIIYSESNHSNSQYSNTNSVKSSSNVDVYKLRHKSQESTLSNRKSSTISSTNMSSKSSSANITVNLFKNSNDVRASLVEELNSITSNILIESSNDQSQTTNDECFDLNTSININDEHTQLSLQNQLKIYLLKTD